MIFYVQSKIHGSQGKMASPGSLMNKQVLTRYSDVFSGLGKFPGEPYKLNLKPDSQPQTKESACTS